MATMFESTVTFKNPDGTESVEIALFDTGSDTAVLTSMDVFKLRASNQKLGTEQGYVLGLGSKPTRVLARGTATVLIGEREHVVEIIAVSDVDETLVGYSAIEQISQANGGDGKVTFDTVAKTVKLGDAVIPPPAQTTVAAGAPVTVVTVPPVVCRAGAGPGPMLAQAANRVAVPDPDLTRKHGTPCGWRDAQYREAVQKAVKAQKTLWAATAPVTTAVDGLPVHQRQWPDGPDMRGGVLPPRPNSSPEQIAESMARGRRATQHHLELNSGNAPPSMATGGVGAAVNRRVRCGSATSVSSVNGGNLPQVDFHLEGAAECDGFPLLALTSALPAQL